MVYRWKVGFRAAVPAQVAGERLAEIKQANGDLLTPSDVVEDARPEGSPLHPCFDWDNEEAGENWRKEQARGLIRNNYLLVELVDEKRSQIALQYVHVVDPVQGPGYVDTRRAVAEPDLYTQVEADAIKALKGLRDRFAHIQSLAGVFAEIDKLKIPDLDQESVAGQKPRRKRA